MANMEKYSLKDMQALCKHVARECLTYSNDNIDLSRSNKNYNLAPKRNFSQMQFIENALERYKHSTRHDLRVCSSWCITCPENVPQARQNDFFKLTYNFLVSRYTARTGLSENDFVVSSFVHLDETTAHMHFVMLNIVNNSHGQRFCCKELFNRSELSTFHKDFDKYMKEHKFIAEIINNNTLYKRVFDKNGNEHFVALNPSDLKSMGIHRERTHEHERERSF